MILHVTGFELALANCKTRFPFRYGMVSLHQAPQMTARVHVEAAGQACIGHAADLLAPKWFEKDPAKSLEDDFQSLAQSARLAAQAWHRLPPATVFDQWWMVYRERVLCVPGDSPDRLVRGFGVALIERAVMDAVCRLAGRTFHGALTEDLFAIRPGQVHPELEDWSVAESLAPSPQSSVQVRHTVGLLDPLTPEEIPENFVEEDGLPVALDEDIAVYGLETFKVKVAGTDATAMERISQVSGVVHDRVGDSAKFTLDGNEQIEDLGAMLAMFDRLREQQHGSWFLDRLLWIEQPLHRTKSFDPDLCAPLGDLTAVAPVILDEADAGIESFPRGIELGYRGVSVKNCKGVIRALLNRGLTEQLESGLFQTAEDLTNLGVLPLQQDLTTIASLGMTHAERNGHHYFLGLGHLPPQEQEQALAAHPALYERFKGGVKVRVSEGQLDISDVVSSVGYGHSTDPHLSARTPLEDWTP